ncbi:MAG: hypothetical protein ABII18_00570 [bacterium]
MKNKTPSPDNPNIIVYLTGNSDTNEDCDDNNTGNYQISVET